MGYTGKVKCIRESNSIFMKEGEIYEIVDGYFYREDCHKNIFPIESIEYFNAEYKTQIEDVKAKEQQKPNKKSKEVNKMNRYKYINCEVGEDGEGEPSILYIYNVSDEPMFQCFDGRIEDTRTLMFDTAPPIQRF